MIKEITLISSAKPEKFIFYIPILSQMQLFILSTDKEVVYGND